MTSSHLFEFLDQGVSHNAFETPSHTQSMRLYVCKFLTEFFGKSSQTLHCGIAVINHAQSDHMRWQSIKVTSFLFSGCYSSDMMDNPIKRRILLESAKQNLRSLTYFSIMPYMNESQYLFERTFGLKFKTPFYRQKNRHNRNSGSVLYSLSESTRRKIKQVNDLDMELFSYAKQLFFQRYDYAKRKTATNVKPTYLLP